MSDRKIVRIPPSRRPFVSGSGGGAPSAPKESSDNYRSRSILLMVNLVTQGPAVGLQDRSGRTITTQTSLGKGIYFNGVPVLTDAGQFTIGADTSKDGRQNNSTDDPQNDPHPDYADLKIAQTLGTQDQPAIDGFPSAEEIISPPNQSITYDLYNQSVTILNSDADTIEVGVQIQALINQDKSTGNIGGSSLSWSIFLSLNGGDFVLMATRNLTKKISNPAIVATSIKLPKSSTPESDTWVLRVVKNTKDSDTVRIKNTITLLYVRVSTNVTLSYPNYSMQYMELDAANVSSIPTLGYHYKGLIVPVPANYFPNTGTYTRDYLSGNDTGVEQIWMGNFYPAYTNNPAWIIYDLMTNTRYGLGNYIDPTNVDKWSLYKIAKYCDQLVPSGFGYKEPRFRCNVYFQQQQDAYKVLQDLCTCFAGAVYWASGALNFVQDSAILSNQVVSEFTNANVQGGIFSYSSSAATVRHTVANVQWNDPEDLYRPKYEMFQDVDGLHRYGYRKLDIPAFGCTSRGQARRLARLLIWTEINQTEVLTFTAGVEGAYLRPFDVIKVMDNDYTSLKNGGRIAAISDDRLTVTMDRGFTISDNGILSFVRPQSFAYPQDIQSSDEIGTLRQPQIYSVPYLTDPVKSEQGIVVLQQPLDASIHHGGIWIFEGVVQAQLFRISGVEEKAPNEYAVTCMQYSDAKYAFVDLEEVLEEPVTSVLPNPANVLPPKNIWVEQGYGVYLGATRKVLFVHWDKPSDPQVQTFKIYVQTDTNNNWTQLESQFPDETYQYDYVGSGTYTFRVVAVNMLGRESLGAVASFTVDTSSPLAQFSVKDLELTGLANGTEFGGKDASFSWNCTSPVNAPDDASDDAITDQAPVSDDPMFDHFTLRIYRTTDEAKVYEQDDWKTMQFTFPYEANCLCHAEHEDAPSGPYREFRFEVTGFDKSGYPTDPVSIVVQNPQVGKLVGVTTGPQFSSVSFYIPPQLDLDFQGVIIWQGTQTGFVPAKQNLVYQGPAGNVPVLIDQAAGATRFYRLAGYDAFGTDNLQINDELQVTNTYLQFTDLTQVFRDRFNITEQNAAGAIEQLTTSPEGAEDTFADKVVALYAIVGDTGALFTEETDTIASLLGATAKHVTDLVGQYNVDDKSQLEIDLETIAQPGHTGAQVLTTLGSFLNGQSNSIQINAQTIDGIKNLYSVTLDNNGAVSGFLLVSEALDPANHVVPSAFKINANALILYSGGVSVFTATAGGVIWNVDQLSSNYQKAVSGYYIAGDGSKAEFGRVFLRNPITFYPTGAPSISPAPGTVQNFPIQLSVAAPDGAVVRFTRNNTPVTTTSKVWPTNPDGTFATVQLGKPKTIRVRSYLNGIASAELIATYSQAVNAGDLPNCADPMIHNTTVYPSAAKVKLKCATANSVITYVLTHANGTTDPAVQYGGGLVTVEVGGYLAVTATAPGFDPSQEVDFYNVDPTALST